MGDRLPDGGGRFPGVIPGMAGKQSRGPRFEIAVATIRLIKHRHETLWLKCSSGRTKKEVGRENEEDPQQHQKTHLRPLSKKEKNVEFSW